jgi:hemerythrin-like domain-containing protein
MYAEHGSLAAVLNALSALLRETRERGKRIDPKVFRAILYYLEVFPEREHHRKEELVLFPLIRYHTHELDEILDELAIEHQSGEQAMHDLELAFLRYEERGEEEFVVFAAAAEEYIESYFAHMRKEEREVMPLAERVLTADEWSRVEAEFASHHDPLAGASEEADTDQLFHRIVMLVPAPYGVGPPLDD